MRLFFPEESDSSIGYNSGGNAAGDGNNLVVIIDADADFSRRDTWNAHVHIFGKIDGLGAGLLSAAVAGDDGNRKCARSKSIPGDSTEWCNRRREVEGISIIIEG